MLAVTKSKMLILQMRSLRNEDRGVFFNRRVKTIELTVRITAISAPCALLFLPVQFGAEWIDEMLLVGVGVRRWIRVGRMSNWRPEAGLRSAIVLGQRGSRRRPTGLARVPGRSPTGDGGVDPLHLRRRMKN